MSTFCKKLTENSQGIDVQFVAENMGLDLNNSVQDPITSPALTFLFSLPRSNITLSLQLSFLICKDKRTTE